MEKIEQLYEEYLYEELGPDTIRNIKSLQIILEQARKFKSAIEGATEPKIIEKSFNVLKRLTEEALIVRTRIRTIVNHYKNRKAKIGSIKNSTTSIRSINADIKKLENVYYGMNEINKILTFTRQQLRNSLENIRKEKEQEKKQEYIKKKTLDYVTTQGIFKIIGNFLKTKLTEKHKNYINFYNSYVLLGRDINAISKGDKKTNSYIRVIKHRLEQFINKFLETGELKKYIKKYSGLNMNFKNNKIILSTVYGAHSERLFKKDVSLRNAVN